MKLPSHAAASAAVSAAVYGVTRSPTAALAALLSGILIDLDHVPDFFLLSGEKFSLSNLISWHVNMRWDRVVLVLHSLELWALLALWAFLRRQDLLFGLAAGTGIHLACDEIGNRNPMGHRLSRWFYFLSYRAWVGFRKERLWSGPSAQRLQKVGLTSPPKRA